MYIIHACCSCVIAIVSAKDCEICAVLVWVTDQVLFDLFGF